VAANSGRGGDRCGGGSGGGRKRETAAAETAAGSGGGDDSGRGGNKCGGSGNNEKMKVVRVVMFHVDTKRFICVFVNFYLRPNKRSTRNIYLCHK
jgi:hypothetical protein